MPRRFIALAAMLLPALLATLLATLVATWLPSPAYAQQDTQAARDAYARLPVCRLGADGRSLEIEPCRTAPAQRPMPRRPVPRQEEQGSRIGIPDTTPAPRPALPSAAPAPLTPYPAAPVPPVPPAVNPSPYHPAPGAFATPTPTRPSPVTCVGDVCRDAAGTAYPGSGTGVTRTPTGRHCTTVGGFVRCM